MRSFMPYWTICAPRTRSGRHPPRDGVSIQLFTPRGFCTVRGRGPTTRTAAAYLRVGHLRHLAQVILRARGVVAEKDLLGDTAAQGHAHAIKQLLRRQQVLVTWDLHRVAESGCRRAARRADRQQQPPPHRLASASRNTAALSLPVEGPVRTRTARDDGHLEERVGVPQEPPGHRMAGLVEGHRLRCHAARCGQWKEVSNCIDVVAACPPPFPSAALKTAQRGHTRFSSGASTCVFFSKPATTRSMAASKCSGPTAAALLRPAIRAASLQMLAMSAPVKPGVMCANFSAISSRDPATLMLRKCTLKISTRPLTSGRSTAI